MRLMSNTFHNSSKIENPMEASAMHTTALGSAQGVKRARTAASNSKEASCKRVPVLKPEYPMTPNIPH
jgi:hypothetical protein